MEESSGNFLSLFLDFLEWCADKRVDTDERRFPEDAVTV